MESLLTLLSIFYRICIRERQLPSQRVTGEYPYATYHRECLARKPRVPNVKPWGLASLSSLFVLRSPRLPSTFEEFKAGHAYSNHRIHICIDLLFREIVYIYCHGPSTFSSFSRVLLLLERLAMKSLFFASLVLGLVSAIVVPRKANYDGYRVVRLQVGDDVSRVKNIIQELSLSTWNGAPKDNSEVDVVVPADKFLQFESSTADLDSSIMHANLGASIARETDYQVYAVGSANSTWFNSYHPYADHIQFLNDLKNSYPSNSEIVTIGNSLQGRPITGIHFYGTGLKNTKPAVVLHGTVHAREWITTMVTEYFAYSFLSGFASNTDIRTLLNKYDFYIFPVVNPDGFVYTQTNDRLWRKNRQSTSGSSCLGHDINRNWNYQWSTPGGSSTDPCAQDFRGSAAADAPETVVLANFVNKLAASAQKLKLFIDYHSYSQLFMTPYGYSCSIVTSNNAEYQSLAQGVAAAIKGVYGTVFKTGPICPTIYQVSGSSVDYLADVTKAQYSFTSELRDTGNYGFVLPANQILPSGVEAFAGFRYLLSNLR